MNLRVTPQILVNQSISNARRQSARLADLQQQASTGLRLLRTSDDPLASASVLAGHAQSLRIDTHLENLREARTRLDISVNNLREGNQILIQAKEIAIEASHASNDATSFEALATEVDGLIQRLLGIANSQHAGRYVFAGTAVQNQPFTVTASDTSGKPLQVSYTGGTERVQFAVSTDQSVATNYSGSQVFQPRQRGTTAYSGSTGAAAGTGTDSATGTGALVVRHTATSYAPGSGVQPGAGSTTGDTIIGLAGAHSLTVIDTSGTGASGTISLNGGPPVAFTNADTNLMVTGPRGEIVYVDTTAITPAFNGTVAITANGAISVDGGLSEFAIDFSSNQTVTDSQTGAVTNVNSSGIRSVGTDTLDYVGTYDAFSALIALRDALRNSTHLGSKDQIDSISRHLAEIDRVREAMLGVVGEQSASLQNLDSLERRLQDVQLEVNQRTSELESADISEVVLNLQSQDNALRLTLATAARMFDQNLLDFLR